MKVFKGCLGPIFCDPFWQGCSVRFVISLYLPKKYDTPSSLEAFLLDLAPEEAPCVSNAREFLLVYWGRKIWLLLYSLFFVELKDTFFRHLRVQLARKMLTLAKLLRRKVIFLKNPGFSVDNHRFSCVLSLSGDWWGGGKSQQLTILLYTLEYSVCSYVLGLLRGLWTTMWYITISTLLFHYLKLCALRFLVYTFHSIPVDKNYKCAMLTFQTQVPF